MEERQKGEIKVKRIVMEGKTQVKRHRRRQREEAEE
jgi:hypothetical protein